MDSNNGKSFAERFGKKQGAFTSESVKKDEATEGKKSQERQDSESKSTKKVDPIKKSMSDLVYLVKGVDDNRNAWYYVLVERMKVNLFLKALNDDIIHLEKYGKILYSAYGDEPPKEITDAIKEEYGIN